MSNLNILSGGAAQGLVGSLAARFKQQTGLDLGGDFGAVGAMADRLRAGTPTDILILTSALIATLAKEGLADGASVKDVGRVETALAVRDTDPLVSAPDVETLSPPPNVTVPTPAPVLSARSVTVPPFVLAILASTLTLR